MERKNVKAFLTEKVGWTPLRWKLRLFYPEVEQERLFQNMLLYIRGALWLIRLFFLAIFLWIGILHPGMLGIALFVSFYLADIPVQYVLERRKRELLVQLSDVMDQVRFQYYNLRQVDAALDVVLEEAPDMIATHLRCFQRVLSGQDPATELEIYEERVKNQYLVTFLALCCMTVLYGDRDHQGGSLFVRNLDFLKQELQLEILRMEKRGVMFSGQKALALLPAFFLTFMERWCLDNVTETGSFFHGTNGKIALFVFFVIQTVLYYMIRIIQEPAIAPGFLTDHHKGYLLYNSYLYGAIELAGFWLNRWEDYSVIFLVRATAVFSFGCMIFPVLLLLHSREKRRTRQEEVMCFQKMIYLLMYMEGVNIREVLIWMERFAVNYRLKITECIDQYELGERAALEGLLVSHSDRDFQILVRQLIISDDVGLAQAFDHLEKDWEYQLLKRKNLFEQELERKRMLCGMFAYLPLFVAVGVYLILPFVRFGIISLWSFFGSMP